MEHYVGLDVSLELSSVCIVDERGTIISEAKVASEPEALIRFLRAQELEIGRIEVEGSNPLLSSRREGLGDQVGPGDVEDPLRHRAGHAVLEFQPSEIH